MSGGPTPMLGSVKSEKLFTIITSPKSKPTKELTSAAILPYNHWNNFFTLLTDVINRYHITTQINLWLLHTWANRDHKLCKVVLKAKHRAQLYSQASSQRDCPQRHRCHMKNKLWLPGHQRREKKMEVYKNYHNLIHASILLSPDQLWLSDGHKSCQMCWWSCSCLMAAKYMSIGQD